MSEEKDVSYMYITASSGLLCCVYPKALVKDQLPDIYPAINHPHEIKRRTIVLQDGSEVYEIAKRFRGRIQPPDTGEKGMHPFSVAPDPTKHDLRIVIGMKMDAYEVARRSDYHHAMMMMGILVALGVGAFFFLFVIQNYYLVDKTLRQSENYNKLVLANMANGLLGIDMSGKIVSYNQLALDYLGIEASKVEAFNLEGVIDFQSWDVWDTIKKSGIIRDREILYESGNRPPLPLALSITPILNKKQGCTGAVIIIHDLREMKALQNQIKHAEKMAAIGEMAAGIAHEIRNPLSSIRGFAKFLHHALENNPDKQEYATVIINEMDRINHVITDLLNLTRPLSPSVKSSDIRQLYDHVMRLVKEEADAKGIDLAINVPETMPAVLIDYDLMTQAILNLVLNAMNAVEKDGRIELGALIVEPEGNVKIWVEDDGMGIEKAHMEKIFDPYFTKRDKGTGLGLPIVKRIVDNHYGSIEVISPPTGKNKGCKFLILIPHSGDSNHA